MKTFKFTPSEWEAVQWAVSQFDGGGVDDSGGSPSRYRAMRSAFDKLRGPTQERRDIRGRKYYQNIFR